MEITAGQVIAKVKDQTVKFGANFDTGTIEHYDGLAEANVGTFNTNVDKTGITAYKVYIEGTDTEAEPVEGKTYYPAGTYDVKAIGTATYPGYNVVLISGKWTVEPKPLAEVDIAELSATYAGDEVKPGVENKLKFNASDYMKENQDFTVSLVEGENIDNTNASAGLVTGKVKFTAAGNNFTGDVEKTFTINKLTVDITAVDKSWQYGTTEPPYTATYELPGKDKDLDLTQEGLEGFTGSLKVKRICASTQGVYDEGIEPYGITAAANYNFNFVKGKLTITGGAMVLKVKNLTAVYNGTTDPVLEYDVELAETGNENLDPVVAANFKSFINTTGAVYTLADPEVEDGGKYVVGKEYPITVTGITSTNYTLNGGDAITAGKLTITKRPVKFTARDKNIDYSDMQAWIDNELEVSDTYIEQNIDAENLALGNGDVITDIIASIAPESKLLGDNVLALTKKTEGVVTNYAISLVSGNMHVNNAGLSLLTLNRVAKADFADDTKNTAAALITEKAGKVMNVTFSDFEMLPEKWYPLVLPFATDVATVSAKFGYAVVNILSDNQPELADGKINLKLHMQEIAAGQPFVVKIYKQKNMKDVQFDAVVIDDAEPIDAKTGVSFIGTYTGSTEGFRSNEFYFSANASYNQYYSGNETNTTYLRPLGAFFRLTNGAPAREITFQEADGSATAIQVVNAENNASAEGIYTVGGVKLQNTPTQKGVYIQNGKKVVIK